MQSSLHPDEPETHGNGKRKRKKTYAIEWRWPAFKPFENWTVFKRYATEEDRDKAIKQLSSNCSAEYRIKD